MKVTYIYIEIMEVYMWRVEEIIGTLSNEDGNANDEGSEKSHFWFTLLFIVQVIRVLFLYFKPCE